MPVNEFNRPVSTDSAPQGSICEWCGKPAQHQLTAIGGAHHNETGLFCRPCGQQFLQVVVLMQPKTMQLCAHYSGSPKS